MSVQQRIESLKSRHADLEAQIAEETNRPLPDTTRLQRLKRDKLKLKEEMEKLADGAAVH